MDLPARDAGHERPLPGGSAAARDRPARRRTVVSIGVPVARRLGHAGQRICGARQLPPDSGGGDANRRTAMLADEWVPIAPGTESAFAQGILQALRQGKPPVGLETDRPWCSATLPRFPKSINCWAPMARPSWPRPEAPVPDSWKRDRGAKSRRLAGRPGSLHSASC